MPQSVTTATHVVTLNSGTVQYRVPGQLLINIYVVAVVAPRQTKLTFICLIDGCLSGEKSRDSVTRSDVTA